MKKLIATSLFLLALVPTQGNAQQWNWDSNKSSTLFIRNKVNKPPLFERSVLDQRVPESLSSRSATCDCNSCTKPVAVVDKPVYTLNPIIRPDGSFHSTRYLDVNDKAGKLYGVSGAAIKAYQQQSMKERNELERRLDAERDCWNATKRYYLNNPTPMLPSKKGAR